MVVLDRWASEWDGTLHIASMIPPGSTGTVVKKSKAQDNDKKVDLVYVSWDHLPTHASIIPLFPGDKATVRNE